MRGILRTNRGTLRDFREICEDRGQPRSRMPVTKWHNQIGDLTVAVRPSIPRVRAHG